MADCRTVGIVASSTNVPVGRPNISRKSSIKEEVVTACLPDNCTTSISDTYQEVTAPLTSTKFAAVGDVNGVGGKFTGLLEGDFNDDVATSGTCEVEGITNTLFSVACIGSTVAVTVSLAFVRDAIGIAVF